MMTILPQRLAFLRETSIAIATLVTGDRYRPHDSIAHFDCFPSNILWRIIAGCFNHPDNLVTQHTGRRSGAPTGVSVQVAAANRTAGNSYQQVAGFQFRRNRNFTQLKRDVGLSENGGSADSLIQ
jgi:hypothetical protein